MKHRCTSPYCPGHKTDTGDCRPLGHVAQGTPTPIDPADIRAGDVVRVVEECTIEERDDYMIRGGGYAFSAGDVPGRTWHLVHRPDPDAEAVEALLTAGLTDDANLIESDTARIARRYLANLREQGWDVTRRPS